MDQRECLRSEEPRVKSKEYMYCSTRDIWITIGKCRMMYVTVVVSHIQRIGCQLEKQLYTVANPARGLLNREKITKENVWQRHTQPHAARSEKIK